MGCDGRSERLSCDSSPMLANVEIPSPWFLVLVQRTFDRADREARDISISVRQRGMCQHIPTPSSTLKRDDSVTVMLGEFVGRWKCWRLGKAMLGVNTTPDISAYLCAGTTGRFRSGAALFVK